MEIPKNLFSDDILKLLDLASAFHVPGKHSRGRVGQKDRAVARRRAANKVAGRQRKINAR